MRYRVAVQIFVSALCILSDLPSEPEADIPPFEPVIESGFPIRPPPEPVACRRIDLTDAPGGVQAHWTGHAFALTRIQPINSYRTRLLQADTTGTPTSALNLKMWLKHVWTQDDALHGLSIAGTAARVHRIEPHRQTLIEAYQLPFKDRYGGSIAALPGAAGIWLVTPRGRTMLLKNGEIQVDTSPQPQPGKPFVYFVHAQQASVDARGALLVVLTRHYKTDLRERERVERVLAMVLPDGRVRTKLWPDEDFRPNQLLAVDDGYLLVGARVHPWPEPRRHFQHLGGRIVRLDADWNVLETVDIDADVGCEVLNGDALTRLTRLPDGWLATGRACHSIDRIYDLWWVKLNAQLAVVRQARIALNIENYQFSVAVADDGALALAGAHDVHSSPEGLAGYFMFVDPEWACLSEPGRPPQSEGTQP